MSAKVATEYRQRFGKAVVIDMFCYRRYGHNEGDEPTIHAAADVLARSEAARPRWRTIPQRLIGEGVITTEDDREAQGRLARAPRSASSTPGKISAQQSRLARRPCGPACKLRGRR